MIPHWWFFSSFTCKKSLKMKFEIFVELDTFCHFLEKKGFIMKLWLGITYSSFPPPLSPPLIRYQRDRTKCLLYYWGKVICIKLDVFKLCANGHNNSQHCWPNNVESCCVHLHMAKSLTSFKLCATTPNNIATKCNRMCQRTQHVTFNNVGSCWLTMLHPFARGFRMKRPYRGVWK